MVKRCPGTKVSGEWTGFQCVLDEGHAERFCQPYVPPTVDEWRVMKADRDRLQAELDALRSEVPGRAMVVVDLGTGSGAIGLSIAQERERVEVWLTDASAEALDVARANLAGLGRAATRVTIAPAGEWFAALPNDLRGRVDLIVSNPPYVAIGDELPTVVRDWEPASALFSGVDGLDDLRTIIAEAPSWLAPGAGLVVELAPMQAAAVAALFVDAGFVDVRIHVDLSGRERCVLGRLSR